LYEEVPYLYRKIVYLYRKVPYFPSAAENIFPVQ
jgi:hypothetical protein